MSNFPGPASWARLGPRKEQRPSQRKTPGRTIRENKKQFSWFWLGRRAVILRRQGDDHGALVAMQIGLGGRVHLFQRNVVLFVADRIDQARIVELGGIFADQARSSQRGTTLIDK